MGLPLATLLHDWAGGVPDGRRVQAVTMAGLSGGFLAGRDLDVTLDEPSIRPKGSFLGAGGIMVFDDSRDMVAVTRQSMEFFAPRVVREVLPLPDRDAAPGGAAGRWGPRYRGRLGGRGHRPE